MKNNDSFADDLERMFAGKVKTHNNLSKNWARAKENKNNRPESSQSSSDDNVGPEIP